MIAIARFEPSCPPSSRGSAKRRWPAASARRRISPSSSSHSRRGRPPFSQSVRAYSRRWSKNCGLLALERLDLALDEGVELVELARDLGGNLEVHRLPPTRSPLPMLTSPSDPEEVPMFEPKRVLSADQIDLSDLEFWAAPARGARGRVRHAARRERPISFHEEPDVGCHAEGAGLLGAHPARRRPRGEPHARPLLLRQGHEHRRHAAGFLEFFGSMINMDDPRHARLRRIVSRGFTPRMLDQLRGRRRAHRRARSSTGCIERGACDFVTDVAAALPLRIICDMMGIPREPAPVRLRPHQHHPRRRRPRVLPRSTRRRSSRRSSRRAPSSPPLVQELGRAPPRQARPTTSPPRSSTPRSTASG